MKIFAFARVLLIFFCLWASAGQDSAFDVETDHLTTVQKTTSGCMYAVNFGDSFHVTSLFNVNPATGMLSAGTNIGIGNVIGLEMHTDGFLYTVRTSGTLAPGTEEALYKINPDTGAATLIGSLGLSGTIFEGDLAFHPSSGVLYGVSGSKFFTVNLVTGAATLLGSSAGGINSDLSSLAFDTSGNLWAIDNTITPGPLPTKLLRLDPANGNTLSSINTSINLGSMGGMDYDEASGDLYVMDSQYAGSVYAGTNSVYTLNTGTGNLTLVGPLGALDGFAGLTACPAVEVPDCMYTINNGDSFHIADIFDVDATNGVVSGAQATSVSNNIGLEMDADGTLYTVEITTKTLHKIDSGTGASTLVGPLGITFFPFEGDLSIDPTSGTLYGVADEKLFTINKSTGAATVIGTVPVGPNGDLSYMTFDGSGNLWVIDNSITAGMLPTVLHSIDPSTANILSSLTLPYYDGGVGGMDHDPVTDQIYILDSKTPGSVYAGSFKVYTLDPITGVRTEVGHTGLEQAYSGLTICPEAPPCTPPPADMVAWWTFNEPNTIGPFTITGTLDISGSPSPNTGVRTGSATYGGNLTLNGGYVEVANDSELNFGPGEDFSVDAWIRTSSNGNQTIVDKRQSVGGKGYLILLYQGRVLVQLADAGGWSNFYNLGNAPINDGFWHFIGVSVDRDNPAGLRVFVDGTNVATFNPTGRAGDLTNTSVLRIGSHSMSTSSKFYGQIDEVEIFERALADSEWDDIYGAGSTGKCNDCMVETAFATSKAPRGEASNHDVISTLKTFRDREMKSTETGLYFADVYKAHNMRAAWLMLWDGEYRSYTASLLRKHLGTFKDMVYGRADYAVSQEMAADGQDWLQRTIDVDSSFVGGGPLSEQISYEMQRIDWDTITKVNVSDLLKYHDKKGTRR